MEKQDPQINIGLDIHGVVDKDPVFWATFMLDIFRAKSMYWKVYILTGHRRARAIKELEALDIYEGPHYVELFSITDYLESTGVEHLSISTDENPYFPQEDWDKAKAHFVKYRRINLVIDDKLDYKDSMPKGTIFLHSPK